MSISFGASAAGDAEIEKLDQGARTTKDKTFAYAFSLSRQFVPCSHFSSLEQMCALENSLVTSRNVAETVNNLTQPISYLIRHSREIHATARG
jgi:hypothetical protein